VSCIQPLSVLVLGPAGQVLGRGLSLGIKSQVFGLEGQFIGLGLEGQVLDPGLGPECKSSVFTSSSWVKSLLRTLQPARLCYEEHIRSSSMDLRSVETFSSRSDQSGGHCASALSLTAESSTKDFHSHHSTSCSSRSHYLCTSLVRTMHVPSPVACRRNDIRSAFVLC